MGVENPSHSSARNRNYCEFEHEAVAPRHGFEPSASLRLHVLSSLSAFIRSLTWIFSSERTASLILWRDYAVVRPVASFSNFDLISLQVKGRFEPPE